MDERRFEPRREATGILSSARLTNVFGHKRPETTGLLAAAWIAAAIVTIGASFASAASGSGALPDWDIAKTCHDQASYAFAATLGQVDLDREIEICATRERASRDLAAAAWPQAPAPIRIECANLAEQHYARLVACLADPSGRR